MKFVPASLLAVLFPAAAIPLSAAPLQPYVSDPNTLVLFHFDEASGTSTTNSGTLGKNAYTVDMTAASATPATVNSMLGATAYSGLGKAASFGTGQLAGWDYNNSGAYQGDLNVNTLSADRLAMNVLNMGNGGQSRWTMEAMVYCTLPTLNAQQEIIATDSSATTRGFQFRINATGQLELNFIATGPVVTAAIPTTGTHAYAANTWFHVAASYDGGYVRFYWTRADATVTAANLIGTAAAAVGTTFGAVTGPLCIGGENRNANGENFNGRLDEVRISRIMRVATAMQPVYSDTDADGLSDAWERLYFNNLDPLPGEDPDADGFTNLQEYEMGTNPKVSNAGDTDGDGLPDSWENQYFGNLAQIAEGDPDENGLTNLQEYQGGSNPAKAASVPGDVDGDSLPDAYEMANLGGLGHGAYDDPDGDGYTNVAEMAAGTDPLSSASRPAWKSPRVSLLRDSVVVTNGLLMPTGSTYGRAINGISYNQQILLTFNGYQYTAWYHTSGNTQNVWLARRTVDGNNVGEWQMFNTGSEFLNGDESSWDAHNVIAIGICPADGTLHLSWDHHNNTLRYRRSIAGLCTTNTAAWGTGMLNVEQNWLVASGQTVGDVTYPEFTTTPTGGLVMNRRVGISGNGDQLLQAYVPITGSAGGNWLGQRLFLARGGNYQGSTDRNAYINAVDFGPDGKIHVTWTWREGASTSNHDICYAYSEDNGVTWRNNAGELIADTATGQSINLDSPGIKIKSLDMNQLLINQQAQCVTPDGTVHALMLHRRAESAYEYPNVTTAPYSTLATAYYHYFRNPDTGVWSQRRLPVDLYPVGSRPKIGYDADGNLYAVYVSYAAGTNTTPGTGSGKLIVSTASKASQYTDWEVVRMIDSNPNGQLLPYLFTGEPLLDQPRLLADGILSVYVQEHGISSSAAVGTPLHVYDFIAPFNTAPTLAEIADQTVNHGTASVPIPLTIADAETPVAGLTLTATSSNGTLLPAANITFSGNTTATLVPITGKSGSSTVTLTVSDGKETASRSFVLTVLSKLETWRLVNFGTTEGTGDAADDADPDGDGRTNHQEYISGTGPRDAANYLKILSMERTGADAAVSFASVAGKSYRVEWSDDLETWTTLQENIAGTGGGMTITDTGGGNSPPRFYRVGAMGE